MILKEPRTIRVSADSELGALLDEAKERPLILERAGVHYRLTREEADEEVGTRYDAEMARDGMRAAAGTWGDIDAEAFKAFVYRPRDEGSRSPDRP